MGTTEVREALDVALPLHTPTYLYAIVIDLLPRIFHDKSVVYLQRNIYSCSF